MKIAILSPIAIQSLMNELGHPSEGLPFGQPSWVQIPIIKKLLQAGHSVTVVTAALGTKNSFYIQSGGFSLFVAVLSPIGKFRAATQFHHEISQIVRFLKQHPCDVYNAHWCYEFALAALRVAPDKTIVTMHDWPEMVYDMIPDFYRYMRLRMARRVFRQCGEYVCNSPYMQGLLLSKYPDFITTVIPNSIETGKANLADKKPHKERPHILCVSNGFFGRKNVDMAVRAFQIIRGDIPGAELHLYGAENEADGAGAQWSREKGLDKNVAFHGKAPHETIEQAMISADLLLHPSREESFGMIFVEAMLAKTPVVAGKFSGAAPWVLMDGQAGALVDIMDAGDIARTCIGILKDVEKWEHYMKAGYESALSRFSADSVAGQWEKVFQTKLSTGRIIG